MASRTAVNAANLEKLGAQRLAEVLVELAGKEPVVKRRLRQELAALSGPGDAAREIRKRLDTIGRGRSFIDTRRSRAFAADLESQLTAISATVMERDPRQALDLLWRFVNLAPSVYERCDDSNGDIADVFRRSCRDLATAAEAVRQDPVAVAGQVFGLLCADHYGLFDDAVPLHASALGPQGLSHLKKMLEELRDEPVETPPADERVAVGWGPGGAIYEDELETSHRASVVRFGLRAIAEAEGDVDGYVAHFDEAALGVPRVAADIAHRMMAAGRLDDAAAALARAADRQARFPEREWDVAHIDCLEAQGQADAAQAHRWASFARGLDPDHLRAYLRRLPDFEDEEAEERALHIVRQHENVVAALAFLVTWPALQAADELVRARAREIDGNVFEILTPAAEALEERHPLAATILLRAMIDFALEAGRSARYRHAARHVRTCEALSGRIEDHGAFETHDAFISRLKERHARKWSFWEALEE